MKKRFLSKSLIAKIALVLVIILVFEFTMSEPVGATEIGGTLLRPIVNLAVYLADGVITILQSALLSVEKSFLYIDLNDNGGSYSPIKYFVCWAGLNLAVGVVIGAIVFALPASAAGALAASSAGLVACAAVRNSCWGSDYKSAVSSSSWDDTSYVWKCFCICEYSSFARNNIKKPNWIFQCKFLWRY